ncbi:MAG: pilin [Candidatus Komeilibacteria bacterium]|nr:pilin [Candidatus Komeilibacteria bacterium]
MIQFRKIIIVAVFVSFVLIMAAPAQAKTQLRLQSSIPGSSFQEGTAITIGPDTLGNYLNAIYSYGIGLVAVLAVVMIILGGFQWIFAAGNTSRIDAAKTTIISALVGLGLALGSYLILATISVELVELRPLNVREIKITAMGCPGNISTCDSVNTQTVEGIKGLGEEALTKLGLNINSSNLLADVCQSTEVHKACGLPSGLCYWGTKDAAGTGESGAKCITLLEKNCTQPGNNDPLCKVNGTQYYCNGVNKKCSLGAVGSTCSRHDECNNGAGLICLNQRCQSGEIEAGQTGFLCSSTGECDVGNDFVCTDTYTQDICVQAYSCDVAVDCQNYPDSGYVQETYVSPNGDMIFGLRCENSYCDCGDVIGGSETDGCKTGYKCIDTDGINGADADVCVPE